MLVSCFVKMLPCVLTPFVRSDAVGAILAEAFLHPSQELSLAEIARRTGVSGPVVHKEVSRLVETRVFTDRRDGNNRLIQVNTRHPLYAPMEQIIAATYGPVPVLTDLLGKVPDRPEAFIYGSWAARRAGEAGPPPRDVDVLVIGDMPVDDLLDVQEAARDRLGMDVNVHKTTRHAWRNRNDDPFLAQVASRPLVPLTGAPDA